MIKKNLWKEWWKHYISFESQLKDIWLSRIVRGEEQTWLEFLEEVRHGWFVEAMSRG